METVANEPYGAEYLVPANRPVYTDPNLANEGI